MWEALVVSHFAGMPNFEHEAALSNGKTPDFDFVLPTCKHRVIGDVRSVSDSGYHKENPIDNLIRELGRIARKHGGDISQFDVMVPGKQVGGNNRKVSLQIPKGAEIQNFTRFKLEPYVRERLAKNDFGHQECMKGDNYRVNITFKPRQKYSSYGHGSYTNIYSVDANPVWNALEDKTKQVRDAPPDTVRMVVLCDAGCDAIAYNAGSGSLSAGEIVENYLKRNGGIDIVVTMSTSEIQGDFNRTKKLNKWQTFVNKKWLDKSDKNIKILSEIQNIFNIMHSKFPEPVANAKSASVNCLNIDYDVGLLGGHQMVNKTINISARSVQRILAGELSISDFNKAHGWAGVNRFAWGLKAGESIREVRIIHSDKYDDDYMEITLDLDPAISKFY